MGATGFDGGSQGKGSEPGSHKPVNTVENSKRKNRFRFSSLIAANILTPAPAVEI